MVGKRYSGVIVKCKDKFLSCKRNGKSPLLSSWSIPGGKIEKNETSLDAAKREFFEETNIDISDEELTFTGVLTRKDRENKKLKGYMYTYFFEVDDEIYPDLESAIDGDEHTECEYFSMKDIDGVNMDENLKKMIRLIMSN